MPTLEHGHDNQLDDVMNKARDGEGGFRPTTLLLHTQLFQFFITQLATQDLADIGGGQDVAEFDTAWHFIAGQVGAHVLHDLVLGQRDARFGDDKDLDAFTRLLVRHANGRALQHAGKCGEYVFQFVGVHVEAGDQDHVLLAVDNPDIAIRLNDRDVAGLEPAIAADHFIGSILTLPVAFHDLRAFDAQFARLAKRQLVAGIIDDLAQRRRHRNADSAHLDVLRRIDRRHRAGLGHAIAFTDGTVGNLLPALGGSLLQGHATRQSDFQRREVEVAKVLVIAQRHKQGVEADKTAELPFRQLLDHRRQIARVADQDVVIAQQHHRHAVKGERVDVIQRQRRDEDFTALIQVGSHQCPTLQHVGDEVAVGQHGALCYTGGAAGVLQHGNIAAAWRYFGNRLTSAFAEHFVEPDGVRQVIGRDHFLHVLDDAVDHQPFERRQHIGHFSDDDLLYVGLGHDLFGQMRHVCQAHQRLGPGIVELVFHFPRGVQRVGIDHDQAGANGTEDGDRVLQHVGQLHGDTVARLQIGVLLDPGGKRTGQLVQLAVRDRLAQIAECRFVSETLAGLFQNRLDVGVLVGVDIGRNAGRVLILPEVFNHSASSVAIANSTHRFER
ncbi:hypothetical protein ALP06_05360 [Pseudomonas coronafaciens pv. atropurpurea]|nr:hypothetical protein ALP06_05360 [Pseudomonas coronafaciens pv. atropurpurea]